MKYVLLQGNGHAKDRAIQESLANVFRAVSLAAGIAFKCTLQTLLTEEMKVGY